MAKRYDIRAAASFGADEVRLLKDLVRALLRRDRETVDQAVSSNEFAGIAAKVRMLGLRIAALQEQRALVSAVLAGEADRDSLGAEGLAELEAIERRLEAARARTLTVRKRTRRKNDSGLDRKAQVERAESIRVEYVRLVDGGMSRSKAWESLAANYRGRADHFAQILRDDRVEATRARLSALTEAAE